MGFSSPKGFQFPGTPKFDSNSVATTPGAAQDLLVINVPASKSRILRKVKVSAPYPSDWVITVNGNEAGSGRTAPGKPDDWFSWVQGYTANSEQEIKIVLTQYTNSPSVIAKAHLESSEINS